MMKRIISVWAIVMMAVSFASCEKETIATSEDLLGDWELSEAETDIYKMDANETWVLETSTTTTFPTDKMDICFRIDEGIQKGDSELEITVFNQIKGKYYILADEDFEFEDGELIVYDENIVVHLMKVGSSQLSLDVNLIVKNQMYSSRVSARRASIDDSKIVKLPR